MEKHGKEPNYTQIISLQEKAEFETLKEEACKNKWGEPPRIGQPRNKRTKARAEAYMPYSPSEMDGITYQNIRYIGKDDVDWFLEREMIIVPKDFETVRILENLKKKAKGVWNFASKPADITYSNDYWQNILICG